MPYRPIMSSNKVFVAEFCRATIAYRHRKGPRRHWQSPNTSGPGPSLAGGGGQESGFAIILGPRRDQLVSNSLVPVAFPRNDRPLGPGPARNAASKGGVGGLMLAVLCPLIAPFGPSRDVGDPEPLLIAVSCPRCTCSNEPTVAPMRSEAVGLAKYSARSQFPEGRR